MKSNIRLSVACGNYDSIQALKNNIVQADGLELVFNTDMGSRERHWRMARRNEFDICEINVAAHIMGTAQGAPLAGLPIFLHRRFRHGFVFVRAGSSIKQPSDLIGKRIGGTNFQPAANVWMRGILEEYYGLPHRSVTWVTERSEDVEFTPPEGLRIEQSAGEKKLQQMLIDNEIDALIAPSLPPAFAAGDARISRLFPDYKAIEMEYFRRSGIFPIMHVTVIKKDVLERDPWIATNLMTAFEAAKQAAYRRVENPRNVPLAWVQTAVEEQRDILGPDPWRYGLEGKNRENIEAILRYTHQQGMSSRLQSVDELFVACDLGDAAGNGGES